MKTFGINMINVNTMNNLSFKAQTPQAEVKTQTQNLSSSNLLSQFLKNQAVINTPAVVNKTPAENKPYKNDLRTLITTNSAIILCLLPRTANAVDTNGNEYIEKGETPGTFLNAIDRLDKIKEEGFNTLHLLPIHPPGVQNAQGTAGSVYAPLDLLKIDPVLVDKKDSRSDIEQFKAFVDACHDRGIRVMVDLPSCASYDLYKEKPELMAMENGVAKVPQGWADIRMFQPWEDEGKRLLNPQLLEYHKKFVDMMIDAGVDGIRADVARAKPVEFWDILISYSRKRDPEFAWLAETYTYEDASPQMNMPYDRPEDSLRSGFDVYYGQYHIFNEWEGAKDLHNYVIDNLKMSYRVGTGKSVIGSFTTHDDISPMYHGGEVFCNLTTGLQATLPMMNPYFVDGYQTGDKYHYSYKDKNIGKESHTDSPYMTVPFPDGRLDIFNLSRKPGGDEPQIGEFMTEALKFREKYAHILKRGSYIVLNKDKDKNDQVIAFARHRQGKTILVIANKNVNRRTACKISVPTMKESQKLNNLLPSYGEESRFQVSKGVISVDLGPGRIHAFEIDTPNIESYTKKVYKQH